MFQQGEALQVVRNIMMPRQGTVVADRYRLERKVGGGRVSAMWRVQDQVTDGTCAIKLLHRSMNDHPEALARFSLEDRLSRELTGDYFPERVGSGSWHSLRYIAWRWYEGECLRALFERNPKQDVQTVYSIVQETCQALTLVHAAGYSHGDLKPENMFFADRAGDASRQLKLLGFGVASRLARPLLGSQARRTPGQIVGTPLYLSPDLILGRVPRGGQADLWALSVIVYEALTGRAPFLGTELSEVLEAILERRAARPSTIANLPATFDVWWTQALEQQFLTPGDFSTSLARALAPALRSSRTQRSASLPDRISRTGPGLPWRAEAVTPHAPEATSGRAGAPTPAGGLLAAAASPSRRATPGAVPTRGGVEGHRSPLRSAGSRAGNDLAASSPAASSPAAGSPAAGSPAAGSPAASSPAVTGGSGSLARAAAGSAPAAHFSAASSPADQSEAEVTGGVSAHLPSGRQGTPATLAPAAPGVSAADLGAAAQPEPKRATSPGAAPVRSGGSPVLGSPVSGSPVAGSPVAGSPAASSPVAGSPADAALPDAALPDAALPDAALPNDGALPAAMAPATRAASPLASTAAGLGSSPLAGGRTAGASAPLVPTASGTAAGIGGAADASALLASARAKAESATVTPGRREPPRPEPSAARPQPAYPVPSTPRSAQASAEESATAEPQRPNVTSTTVAGIGPAALSLMRSRESAKAAAAPSAGAPATAYRAGPEAAAQATASEAAATAQAAEHLAALRDLAVGTRKTLVGIIPPAASRPAAPAAAPLPSAAPAPAPAAAAATTSQTLAIAGTPCRSIDVSSDDEAIDSVLPLRRIGNSTVPFPRPRATPRSARLDGVQEDELAADAGHDHGAPQSWRRRTHNTLRVVLTDRDHRPHLVAGLLVCSAAALVIFALGRSPVSGTGMLGQTTGSLSGREGTSAVPADHAVGSRTAAAGGALEPASSEARGSTAAGPHPAEPLGGEPERAAAAGTPPAGPVLQGEELAPGLVVPPRATPAPSAQPPAAKPPAAAPPPGPPRAPAAPATAAPPRSPNPGSPNPGGSASGGPAATGGAPRGAAPSPIASPPPRSAAPIPAPGAPAPGAPPPRAVPPKPTNPDFDFGI